MSKLLLFGNIPGVWGQRPHAGRVAGVRRACGGRVTGLAKQTRPFQVLQPMLSQPRFNMA